MLERKKEPDHLETLVEAKRYFRKLLMPRIENYELRLKRPWLERGLQYIQTSYGKEGYDRTKNFLDDMDSGKVTRTEDLIELTTRDKYQQGNQFPHILQCAVLRVCKFDSRHVELVKDYLIEERQKQHRASVHIALSLATFGADAKFHIYQKIVKSKDYGNSYLNHLNKILANKAARQVRLQG